MIDKSIPVLPKIDEVEVLELKGKMARISNNLVISNRIVKVEGELAEQIASLWRKLKSGESARCHIPPFGLRFYFKENVVLQASICWECNNMYLYQGDSCLLYGIDLKQSSAKALFDLLEKIMNLK